MLQVGPWVFAAGQVASDYKTGVAPEARRNLEAVKLQSLDLFGAQRDGRVTRPKSLSASSPRRCTKASASRKLRNRNVRSMRRASSRSSHSGARLWKRRA